MAGEEVHVVAVSLADKAVLQHMLELYLHDLSEFEEELRLNQHGLFGYRYLDHYWTEPGRYPLFIELTEQLAGFALVRRLPDSAYSVAEFFVLRYFRRTLVGSRAAMLLFDRFPGPWEVRQAPANLPAQAFWRRVIGEYTHGNFVESRDEADGQIVQRFTAS
jgi:predicted acetyltransferase